MGKARGVGGIEGVSGCGTELKATAGNTCTWPATITRASPAIPSSPLSLTSASMAEAGHAQSRAAWRYFLRGRSRNRWIIKHPTSAIQIMARPGSPANSSLHPTYQMEKPSSWRSSVVEAGLCPAPYCMTRTTLQRFTHPARTPPCPFCCPPSARRPICEQSL